MWKAKSNLKHWEIIDYRFCSVSISMIIFLAFTKNIPALVTCLFLLRCVRLHLLQVRTDLNMFADTDWILAAAQSIISFLVFQLQSLRLLWWR